VNSHARPHAQVLVHAASPCYTRLPVDGRAARRADLARFPRWRNLSNPTFRGTLTILVYQPNVSIAQPIAVVCGSLLGAAIGTVLSVLLGLGPGVALLAALTAMIMLPLLRVFHPPGVALAMCPALLHCGAWFAILVVLPFTLAAVISCAVLSRLVGSWPRYPAPF
jgi:CBS-domain-containing membrane protein